MDETSIMESFFSENENTFDNILTHELYKTEDFNGTQKNDDADVLPSSLLDYLLPCILDKEDLDVRNNTDSASHLNDVLDTKIVREERDSIPESNIVKVVSTAVENGFVSSVSKFKSSTSTIDDDFVTISLSHEPSTDTVRLSAETSHKYGPEREHVKAWDNKGVICSEETSLNCSANRVIFQLLECYETFSTLQNSVHNCDSVLYKCYDCMKSFTSPSTLEEHKLRHSETGKTIQCLECKKFFKTLSGLKHHVRGHSSNYRYICQQCGQICSNQTHFNLHSKQHGNMRPYQCVQCKKRFMSTDCLRLHRRKHCKKVYFHCPQCDKSFANKENMDVHIRKHNGLRPYKCNICLKFFSGKGELNIHLRRHKQECPVKCPYCDKTFPVNCQMKVHLQTHNIKLPYQCTKCEKSFVFESHLRIHIRVHDEESRYRCAECKRTFVHIHHLRRHISHMHENRSRYQCPKCEKNYIWPSDYKKHLRGHANV